MTIDEPINELLIEAAKKALWRARNDTNEAKTFLSEMLKADGALREDISGVVIRSVQRDMLWTEKPMG